MIQANNVFPYTTLEYLNELKGYFKSHGINTDYMATRIRDDGRTGYMALRYTGVHGKLSLKQGTLSTVEDYMKRNSTDTICYLSRSIFGGEDFTL